MLKYIIITFIILWLSFKVAGFVIRMFLRSAGFTFSVNGKQAHSQQSRPSTKPDVPANNTRHVTDSLGDYVDFEEVK